MLIYILGTLFILFIIVFSYFTSKTFGEIALQEQKLKKIIDFFEEEKLLMLNSFLNTDESLNEFKKEFKIDLSSKVIRDVIDEKSNANQASFAKSLLNGEVDLKNTLKNHYEVDMSIIDKEILNIENEFTTIFLDINEDDSENCSPDEKLLFINSYYDYKIQEAEQLLYFTCNETESFDFELEQKKMNNLKYYPDYQQNEFSKLEEFEHKHDSEDNQAVEFFATRVLKNSVYPSYISKEFEVEYNNISKMLIIDYKLPNINDIPEIEKVKLSSSKNSIEEICIKEKVRNKLYEDILYQVVLRTNYELFYHDTMDSIECIVFNGWVEYIDKADGLFKTACIMSMQAGKEEFLSINLERVEPKECFKKFRGISGRDLNNIIGIKPIVYMNKDDKRFIDAYGVMNTLDEADNLACMDWQDFENLVREVFEKEFSQNGGEVKITQSSRDGGVDAIAFDPDPIRGGKIVIQAKRYTNTVGVSAVRDLYGTVMNEGATKGILVTTSDYGPDSFEFAKDKPLTLLNGPNLLHLLEKHGHRAKIDLREAKEILRGE